MAVDKSTPILVVDDYQTMIRIVRNRVALAEQAGADAYIVKPFNAEVLSDRIAAVMGR